MSIRRSATERLNTEVTCRVFVSHGRVLRVWRHVPIALSSESPMALANDLYSSVRRIVAEYEKKTADRLATHTDDWSLLISRVIDLPHVAAVQLADVATEIGYVCYVNWPE